MEAQPAKLREDLAYILPMAVFLIGVWIGGWPALYVPSYIARVIAAAVMLRIGWPAYTRITWNYAWLGLIGGVVGVVQWIAMQHWLEANVSFFGPDPASPPFDPLSHFSSLPMAYLFIAFRWLAGASLVVPVMEELFWRDFAWRSILAPSDFKLARIGEWDWRAFLGVALIFSTVHGHWWLTAIVWALLIGGLLLYTKSLGACIVMHATTNFLLGAYVLATHEWRLW